MNTKILIGVIVVIIAAAAGWISLSDKTGGGDFVGEDVTYVDDEATTAVDDEVSDEEFEDALNELTTDVNHEINYEHVMPGVYSEVYLTITGGTPGETVERELEGPGVESDKRQTATFDEEGNATLTWRINLFGTYVASKPKPEDPLLDFGDEERHVAQVTVR